MSLSFWRSIGSPHLNWSPTTFKAFDECGFKPYGILNSLAMEFGGKTISIDGEVVDEPIDYNLFLVHSWFYAMTIVLSSFFHTLQFPHEGKIVTIDQINVFTLDIHSNGSKNVPFVNDSKLSYESVGVGLLKYSSVMGTFPITYLS